MQSFRIDYAHGYHSRERALDAIEDMFATGEINESDMPRIDPYFATLKATGKTVKRYKITLVTE